MTLIRVSYLHVFLNRPLVLAIGLAVAGGACSSIPVASVMPDAGGGDSGGIDSGDAGLPDSPSDAVNDRSSDGGPISLPPPAKGFHLEVTPFDIPAAAEIQRCYFFEVPSDTDTYVNRIQLAQEPGSHHLNVFRVKSIVNLSGKNGDIVADGECWKSGNWADWPLVINSQASQPGDLVDFDLPPGVAHKFAPRELLMVQSHYVNATTQKTPGRGHALVNFHSLEASQVTAELGTMFATDQNIRVCPGDDHKTFSTSCRVPGAAVTIVGANGHFHSRGKKFTISTWDATTGNAGAPFYASQSWDDPPMAFGLNIPIKAGDGISYSCEFSAQSADCGDPKDSCCFSFGGHVETQEHCNAFVYYYPKQQDVTCF